MTRGGAAGRQDAPCRAFSLIELVMVIGIMAIVAAIATPRYAQSVARYRVQTGARRMVQDLAMARERARSLGASQTVVFNPRSDSYQIAGVRALNGTGSDYTVDLAGGLYRSKLVSANFGGDRTVVFNGYGYPDSGGTAVVRIGDITKTVVLDAQTGRAAVQ